MLLGDQKDQINALESQQSSNFLQENEKNKTMLGGMFGPDDPSAILSGIGDIQAKARIALTSIASWKPKDSEFPEADYQPSEISNYYDSAVKSYRDEALTSLKKGRVDPLTTGYVASVAKSIEGTLPFYFTPAGPTLPALVEGTASYAETEDSGLNENERKGKAIIDASWAFVNGLIPASIGAGSKPALALKGSLLATGIGAADQLSNAAYLESIGHHDMAAQYERIDYLGMTTNAIFGALAGSFHKPVPTQVIDAALVGEKAAHIELSGKGYAGDSAARNAHVDAFNKAHDQVSLDEPVSVSNYVKDRNYIPMPENENVQSIIENILREGGFNEEVARVRALEGSLGSEADSYSGFKTRSITEQFRSKLTSNYEGAIKEYSALGDTLGGKIINTDSFRELSPHYLKNRALSADVHEPASEISKKFYAQKLAEDPKPGEDNAVLFMGGGTGAGKTTALQGFADASKYQIVYDTNMNKYDSAKTKIEQALKAGKSVDIAMVYRDPVDALVNGALPRAERQIKEFGTGRTVPIGEHVNTHVGSAEVIPKLYEEYKDNKDVNFTVIDNSNGKGNQSIKDMEFLKSRGYTDIEKRVRSALDEEYKAGRISKETYDGFSGKNEKNSGSASEKSAGQNSEITPGEYDSTSENSLHSTVPDQSGNPIPASKALDSIESEQKKADELSKTFEPVADCAMRFGK